MSSEQPPQSPPPPPTIFDSKKFPVPSSSPSQSDPSLKTVECIDPLHPCYDYASEVLSLATQAEASAGATMAGLMKLQSELRQAEATIHEVLRIKANTIASIGGLKHLTKSRFPGVIKPAKAVTACVVLAVISLLTGNRMAVTEQPKSAAQAQATLAKAPNTDALDNALRCMRGGDHAGAAMRFRMAADSGCDPELCLGRLAECYYYLRLDTDALAACDELTVKVPSSGWAPFVRGLVLKRQGRAEEARYEFNTAAVRGHRAARLQLGNLGSVSTSGH